MMGRVYHRQILEPRFCMTCGVGLVPRRIGTPGEWRKRKYCTLACFAISNGRNRKGKLNPECHFQRTCKWCGATFMARRFNVVKGEGHGRYCSLTCLGLSQRKREVREFQGKKYYLNKHGYFSTTSRRGTQPKTLLHRAIWESVYGPIPAGMVIHHKDGNKINNDVDNLEMMTPKEHLSLHYWLDPRRLLDHRDGRRTTADQRRCERRVNERNERERQ